MQIPELFRRAIIVPLDDNSQRQLEQDDVSDRTQVESIEMDDSSLLDTLWSTGFFGSVNERANSLIADYKTECLNALVLLQDVTSSRLSPHALRFPQSRSHRGGCLIPPSAFSACQMPLCDSGGLVRRK